MAFHKRILGQYGRGIFCDYWGYVPQIGDTPRQFDFRGRRYSRREWNRIVWECERVTRDALKKLRSKSNTR